MPGSHLDCPWEWLVVRDSGPLRPIPPVEAALRDAGGLPEKSNDAASGACAIASTVVSRKASIALLGVAVAEFFALEVKEESIRSA